MDREVIRSVRRQFLYLEGRESKEASDCRRKHRKEECWRAADHLHVIEILYISLFSSKKAIGISEYGLLY